MRSGGSFFHPDPHSSPIHHEPPALCVFKQVGGQRERKHRKDEAFEYAEDGYETPKGKKSLGGGSGKSNKRSGAKEEARYQQVEAEEEQDINDEEEGWEDQQFDGQDGEEDGTDSVVDLTDKDVEEDEEGPQPPARKASYKEALEKQPQQTKQTAKVTTISSHHRKRSFNTLVSLLLLQKSNRVTRSASSLRAEPMGERSTTPTTKLPARPPPQRNRRRTLLRTTRRRKQKGRGITTTSQPSQLSSRASNMGTRSHGSPETAPWSYTSWMPNSTKGKATKQSSKASASITLGRRFISLFGKQWPQRYTYDHSCCCSHANQLTSTPDQHRRSLGSPRMGLSSHPSSCSQSTGPPLSLRRQDATRSRNQRRNMNTGAKSRAPSSSRPRCHCLSKST